MTDILFDIKQYNDFMNYNTTEVQVSGPQAVNPGSYQDTVTVLPTINILLLPQMMFPWTLDVAGNAMQLNGDPNQPPAINIPPAMAGTDSTPGLCCEVRNSTGANISVPVTFADQNQVPYNQSIPQNQSYYFVIESPLSATMWSQTPCCVAQGTPVETADGQLVRIQDLKPGDAVLDFQRRPVTVSRVIRFDTPTRNFVQLGQLRICRDHPVLDGDLQERPCQEAEGAEAVTLATSLPVYTLVTEHKAYVLMQEQAVATWSERAWRVASASLPSYRELE